MSLKVLLVQTQAQSVRALNRFFKDRDADVVMAYDLGEAAARLAAQEYDLMLLDLHFPGDEWQEFISIVASEYPSMKVILTTSYPDREREFQAQALGFSNFLRQPFTSYLFDKALRAAGIVAREEAPASRAAPLYRPPSASLPSGLKLTLPFLVIVLLVALGSAAIAGSYFVRQTASRFDTQLANTGRLASIWIAAQEDQLAQTLRLIANAQDVAGLIQSGDSEGLRLVILPIAANSDEETVDVLDAQGMSLLSLRKTPEDLPGLYDAQRGDTLFQREEFVQAALRSQPGEPVRTSGFVETPWGGYFYTCSPIVDANGAVVGAALIGRSPERILSRLQAETQSHVTIYDASGRPLASTLFGADGGVPLETAAMEQAVSSTGAQGLTRTVEVGGEPYSELLTPLGVGGGASLGTVGLAMENTPAFSLSNLNLAEILSFLAAAILLVVLMGFLLSYSASSRSRRLALASSQIAAGNTSVPIEIEGNDEIASVARSFKQVVQGFEENRLARDVLGHSATPELHDEFRQSVAMQNLRLEGQEMMVTILKTRLHSFKEFQDQADAVKLFEWLNEYYGILAPVVVRHLGIVNRLEGSSLTAYFGVLPAAQSPGQSVAAACRAAQEMLSALEAFNRARIEAGDLPMRTGIAIHTGQVMAGALSYGEKLDYALLGDTVQAANVLADWSTTLGDESQAFLSRTAASALNESGISFPLEPVTLKDASDESQKRYVYRLLAAQSMGELETHV